MSDYAEPFRTEEFTRHVIGLIEAGRKDEAERFTRERARLRDAHIAEQHEARQDRWLASLGKTLEVLRAHGVRRFNGMVHCGDQGAHVELELSPAPPAVAATEEPEPREPQERGPDGLTKEEAEELYASAL